jgi:hypothetical protein
MRLGLQAAAAVLLVGVGALAGRWSARSATPVAASSVAGTSAGGSSAQLASTSTRSDTTRLVTVEDALGVMQRAENDYRIAAAFVAAHDTSFGQPDSDRYRTRLAALDKVSNAALAAVNEAPSDPVVNQYLLSARSARAVTLQQLRRTLPTGYTLTSY